MPLNYSKWDQLELSDDSDIEGHPNVDKKSLIRWKQRDIHEKREARKQRISQYKVIIDVNTALFPRIQDIVAKVESGGPSAYSSIVEKLKTDPSPDAPQPAQSSEQDGGNAPTIPYDRMILDLLLQVHEAVKGKGITQGDAEHGEALVSELKEHIAKLKKSTEDSKAALEDEEKEQKKHITSEDIHEGFDSTSVTKPVKPAVLPTIQSETKKKTKKAETTFEVLNPKASTSNVPTSKPEVEANDSDEEIDSSDIPRLTPVLLEFSNIPVGRFEQSYRFIQKHPSEVIVTGAYDALLVAAFHAAMEQKLQYAKQCTHQSLLIQYCEKLGRDGVQLFFQKMINADPKALMAFNKDLEDTFAMMKARAANVAQEEERGGKETIQLVAEDPSHTITFNVPDGPPPPLEKLVLQGPGTEELDKEQVHKMLETRWNVFQAFEPKLQDALKGGSLDAVNEILGDMDVAAAEDVVQQLDLAGILSFSRQGIVDETPAGKAAAAEKAKVEEGQATVNDLD